MVGLKSPKNVFRVEYLCSCMVHENIEIRKYLITLNWAGIVLHDYIKILVILDYIGLEW